MAQNRHENEMVALVDGLPAVVWETRANSGLAGETRGSSHTAYVNAYFERLTGYTIAQWIETAGFWQSIVHPDDAERVSSGLRRIEASGDEGTIEFRWIAANGTSIDMEAHIAVIRDAAGAVAGLRGIAVNAGGRKDLEANLQERIEELAGLTAALKHKTEELEQFTYVTSHDLKAPLRGIANLSAWIEEDFGETIPEQVASHLRLLRLRVGRMQSMIDGILEYSRIDSVTARQQVVDVRELIDRVVEVIDMPERFHIEIDAGMPILKTERLRLERVFMALLQNAVKHHDRDEGKVRVGACDEADRVTFTVSDDGPGIPPEYHGKVFQMFQTLDSRDATENMGIGLSMAKKIVEHQGGKIEIEPQAGRGTVITFTWMKRNQE